MICGRERGKVELSWNENRLLYWNVNGEKKPYRDFSFERWILCADDWNTVKYINIR